MLNICTILCPQKFQQWNEQSSVHSMCQSHNTILLHLSVMMQDDNETWVSEFSIIYCSIQSRLLSVYYTGNSEWGRDCRHSHREGSLKVPKDILQLECPFKHVCVCLFALHLWSHIITIVNCSLIKGESVHHPNISDMHLMLLVDLLVLYQNHYHLF